MEQYRFLLGRSVVEIPWWWFDALLAWMGIIGVILWLFGRHLIRPFFGVAGLFAGAMAGTVVALRLFAEIPPLPFVVGGAMLGAILAWTMYRFGMASVLGMTAALVAPVVLLALQGVASPALGEPIRAGVEELLKNTSIPESATTDVEGRTTLKEGEMPPPVSDAVNKGIDGVKAALESWWTAVPPAAAGIATVAMLGGLVGGIVVGLFFPGVAAAFVASLLGTLLMASGVRRVGGSLVDALTPPSDHGGLMLLGAAVLIGATLQLTVFRKSGG